MGIDSYMYSKLCVRSCVCARERDKPCLYIYEPSFLVLLMVVELDFLDSRDIVLEIDVVLHYQLEYGSLVHVIVLALIHHRDSLMSQELEGEAYSEHELAELVNVQFLKM